MSRKNIALQGICYDEKSSFQKGPAKAPSLIRERLWSEAYNAYTENGVEISRDYFVDKGDFAITDYWSIYEISKANLESGSKLFTLGGDHSISYPIVKAVSEHFSGFDLLHIDAHADLYDEFEGDRFSHACPFARIMEDNLVSRLIQVGIRTLTPNQRNQVEKYNIELIEMKNIAAVANVTFEKPLYISLDIDAFDPAFAPGVSHQESGGMNVREVMSLFDQIDVPVIGADIVEYNPENDVAGITAALSAKMLKEILARM